MSKTPFLIETISYGAPDAAAKFVRSLHETGFAVLRDHPISPATIEERYSQWGQFFASEEKHDWTFDKETQAGYFPFRSENAKDHAVKDLKEFYHVYEDHAIPKDLESGTREFHRDLVGIGSTLLGWIQEAAPAELCDSFSEPLPNMIEGSKHNLLRVLHYPPLEEGREPAAVRAAAHGDINLLTVLVAGTAPGLQAQDTAGNWVDVPCDPGMIAINAGDMLDMVSGGYFPSTIHRVVNPPEGGRAGSRFSMPMFLHPRSDVVLQPSTGKTSGQFLHERLQELGLK